MGGGKSGGELVAGRWSRPGTARRCCTHPRVGITLVHLSAGPQVRGRQGAVQGWGAARPTAVPCLCLAPGSQGLVPCKLAGAHRKLGEAHGRHFMSPLVASRPSSLQPHSTPRSPRSGNDGVLTQGRGAADRARGGNLRPAAARVGRGDAEAASGKDGGRLDPAPGPMAAAALRPPPPPPPPLQCCTSAANEPRPALPARRLSQARVLIAGCNGLAAEASVHAPLHGGLVGSGPTLACLWSALSSSRCSHAAHTPRPPLPLSHRWPRTLCWRVWALWLWWMTPPARCARPPTSSSPQTRRPPRRARAGWACGGGACLLLAPMRRGCVAGQRARPLQHSPPGLPQAPPSLPTARPCAAWRRPARPRWLR